MDQRHKNAIARSRRGSRQSPETRRKISRSMEGKKNHQGKKHTVKAKNLISIKRGDYDPIKGRSWIVNRTGKTFRRKFAPQGFQFKRRLYKESSEVKILSFKSFLNP